ncbi:hypothetical protein QO002_001149 [Pararhizobium capsulatum DSM 1112]|uniref:DUF982 domain-containing protein n=1 Tax=Pararhizobium capsulatum DSM 1112 TaxID=1121113 RepID=A0ABU0BMW1_9HYPH|nr:hypothetical protein [Pararhizobium capsulatum DSM 1112]
MQIAKTRNPTDVKWLNPVHLQIQGCPRARIDGPAQAPVYLTQQWPSHFGYEHEHARTKYMSAMAGRLDAEQARKAFVAAAVKANVIGNAYHRAAPRRQVA